jgi:hypothetical protein
MQKGMEMSPREREFLSFPTLTLLAVEGVDTEWFRRPANPLSLGRAEDLVVDTKREQVEVSLSSTATIRRQCLPFGIGSGTVYATPLYFVENRRPVAMAPKTDAVRWQTVSAPRGEAVFALIGGSEEAFYLWRFGDAAG